MREYYKIGEISRIFNIEVPTLRYYDEIGILKPDRVDERTGYRYYHLNQFSRIAQLITFRQLDIPISTIREWLHSNSLEETFGVLEDAERMLEDHMESIEKKLEMTVAVKNIIREAMEKEEDFAIVQSPEFYLYTYDMTGRNKDVDMIDIVNQLDRLQKDFLDSSRFFVMTSLEDFKKDRTRTILSRGLATKEKFELSDEYRILRSRKCLHCFLEGRVEDLDHEYVKIYDYMEANGLRVVDDILEMRVTTYYKGEDRIIVKEIYFPVA